MKVIFTGDPAELAQAQGLSRLSTTIYGVTFPMSVEVDVSHLPEKLQQKLLNNLHFRAAGVDAPAVPLILPVAMPVAAPAPEAAAEAAAEAEEAPAPQAAPRTTGTSRKRTA